MEVPSLLTKNSPPPLQVYKRLHIKGESDFRHWDELNPDVLGLIFRNLELREVLQVIPLVCKSWCKVVEGPYCWQRIDIDEWSKTKENSPEQLERMLETLITRSSGSLRELVVSCMNSGHMIPFIAKHAGSLQTLTIRRSTLGDSTIARVASKFSSLTALDMNECYLVSTQTLEAIGRNCKNLVSLSWNRHPAYTTYKPDHADEVLTIAHNMPKLKHLSLGYLDLETLEVLEILSCCPELELLNIHGCWEVSLDSKFLEEKYPKVKVIGPLVVSKEEDEFSEEEDEFSEESSDGYDGGMDGSDFDRKVELFLIT